MNTCILTDWPLTPQGYGRKSIYPHGEVASHRWAWMQVHGEIPKGMLICHTCDERRCINPEHLFLGTRADNNKDAQKKGRMKNQSIGMTKHLMKAHEDPQYSHDTVYRLHKALAKSYGRKSWGKYKGEES